MGSCPLLLQQLTGELCTAIVCSFTYVYFNLVTYETKLEQAVVVISDAVVFQEEGL